MRKRLFLGLVIVLVFMMAGICLAFGGKVTYPDGTPAVGATVQLVDSINVEQTTTCDASGKFEFTEFNNGFSRVLISAPDGKNYAPVTLPATVFEGGEVAIVLQSK